MVADARTPARDYRYILGVPNFANYEASTAIAKVPRSGGNIEYVAIGEDRITRLKHTYMFPLRGIHYCLQAMGLESLSQIDAIVTDYARLARWMNSGPAYRKLEHDYLKLNLDYPRNRIHVVDHHLAHAASAFYPSEFEEAAVLVVDGLGSGMNTQSLFHFTPDGYKDIERGNDWGVGRLYSMITGAVLPYGPEKGYGKVMGLAPYGEHQPGPVIDFHPRDNGMETDYSEFFTRFPTSRLVATDIQRCDDRERVLEPYPSRAAYDVQQECERQLIRMANYAHQKTGSTRLCLSGGVVLNGAANLRILEETPIEEIWVQPGCSDTGIPFGLALWGCFNLGIAEPAKRRSKVSMTNAYTGRSYTDREIDSVLDRWNIESRPAEPAEVAALLADGKVCAWFDGGSEFGPRALGHRSIIADPRSMDMKDHLNSSVKFREGYRPYAPSILAEHASEWLELDCPSPFMLMLPRVREEKREIIPAVTHIDGTTRPQTVTEKDNGNYYHMINEFYRLTSVPLVLNTSFNINKEPIVETPLDALVCALGTAIDFLYLQGRLVDCAPHRDPAFVDKLIKVRKTLQDQEWDVVTHKYLYHYDTEERDRYLQEENRIAEWYRDYRSKYELEKAMQSWREDGSRVLVAGTRAHTKTLFMYIPEFPSIDVSGFVAFDELPGEQAEFSAYSEVSLSNVNWTEVDVVLVSSHEYQRHITQAVKSANSDTPVVNIYDDACDSLCFVLDGRWPTVNPLEAEKHNLTASRNSAPTSCNIDFDFQPALPTFGERYALIINYHYCHPTESPEFRGLRGITPDDLDKQLEILSRDFHFATVDDLLNPDAELPASVAVITFDDGLKDVKNYAMPVLDKWGASATIYCSSAPIANHSLLDVHRIHLLQGELGVDEFRKRFEKRLGADDYGDLDDPGRLGITDLYRYDDAETRRFKMLLNYQLPYPVVATVLRSLIQETFGDEAEVAKRLYLSMDELRVLKSQGVSIGFHTHNHYILSRLSYQEQRRELTVPIESFGNQLGLKTHHIAYPYGANGTWNHQTKRLLKELDFHGGLTMARRIAKPRDLNDRWEIPRFDVRDVFDRDNQLNVKLVETLFSGD